MATIRKAKSGWWQAIVRRKGHPIQSKTYEAKRDAEEWARDIETRMDRGVFVDRSEAEATTLHEALERYEREVTVKKDGAGQERVRIRSWKNDPLAKCSLASLRGADFAKWRDDRLENVSPSTVQKDLAVISHLFTVAIKDWGLAVTNPIASIKVPTEDNSRIRRFEDDEEERLLAELKPVKGRSIWMIPVVQFAAETAVRQSELLALKWADVDPVRPVVRIRGKDREDGKSRTKNRDKFRDVPLSPRAGSVLAGLPRSIDGRVFPVSAPVVRQAFTAAVKRAGISDFVFHDLRHEATSRLAEQLALHELMKVTGHSSTRMLARYYHPRAEDMALKLIRGEKMPYTVSSRQNAGKTEYIVLNSGTMAPPPHGGPFSTKEAADANCAALLAKLSIEEWIAAHPDSFKVEQIEGEGKVLHIAPDGQWIQNRGRNTFAVHPATDLELEVGEMVRVDKSGDIEFLDRSRPGHGID